LGSDLMSSEITLVSSQKPFTVGCLFRSRAAGPDEFLTRGVATPQRIRRGSLARFGLCQPGVFLGGDHDNNFPAMLDNALWIMVWGKAKHLAEARFGLLKLPLLLDDLAF
jgi:hypothetical protein